MKKNLLLTFWIIAFAPLALSANEQPLAVRVLAVNEPPASYLSSSGKVTGYATDIVTALLAETRQRIQIELVPEARALNIASSQPNVLLFSFSRIPTREKQFHWIGEVLRKDWVVYGLTDTSPKIENLMQLKTFAAIGVVRGDVREKWLISRGVNNLHSVTQHKQNIQLLLLGRLPLIAYEQTGLKFTCLDLNLDCSKITPLHTLKQASVYLMMSKPDTLISSTKTYQNAFNRLITSGKLKSISLEWKKKLKEQNIQVKLAEDVPILTF